MFGCFLIMAYDACERQHALESLGEDFYSKGVINEELLKEMEGGLGVYRVRTTETHS